VGLRLGVARKHRRYGCSPQSRMMRNACGTTFRSVIIFRVRGSFFVTVHNSSQRDKLCRERVELFRIDVRHQRVTELA
jgi:hypothetical protein